MKIKCVILVYFLIFLKINVSLSEPKQKIKTSKEKVEGEPKTNLKEVKPKQELINLEHKGIEPKAKQTDLQNPEISKVNPKDNQKKKNNKRNRREDRVNDRQKIMNEDSDNKEHMSKTVGIAMKAFEEARAANLAQNSAGLQAAKEVKLQLADKAQRAANAAQAALSEKESEIHLLEDQLHDAESVMLEEHGSFNQTKANVNTAIKTVQIAKEQYNALISAIKLAEKTINTAQDLSQGAQHELDEKMKLMTAAKHKIGELQQELQRARSEYLNTRDNAQKAMEAAKEAISNANN